MKTRIFSLRSSGPVCVLMLPAALLWAQDPASDLLRDPAWIPEVVELKEAIPPVTLPHEAPWAADPLAQGPSEHRLEQMRDKALLVKPGLPGERGGDGDEHVKGEAAFADPAKKGDPEGEGGEGKENADDTKDGAQPLQEREPPPAAQKTLRDLHPGEWLPETPEPRPAPRERADGDDRLDEAREHRKGPPDKSRKPHRGDSPEAGKDPSKIYLQGHFAMKEGMVLEDAGDFEAASKSYARARDFFEAAHRADPNWQKQVMAFRLETIRNALQRVAQKSGHVPLEDVPAAEHRPRPEVPGQQPRRRDLRPPFKTPPPFPHDAPKPFAAPPVQNGRHGPEAQPGPPISPPDQSPEALLQRLRHLEHALQESRQRESALRNVLRDVLNESGPAPAPGHAPREKPENGPHTPPGQPTPPAPAPPPLPQSSLPQPPPHDSGSRP